MAALQDSDEAFTMFRQFKMLHCRLLLLGQQELCDLEKRLNEIDTADRTQLFLSSRTYDDNLERNQVLSDIRTKLRQYGPHHTPKKIPISIYYAIRHSNAI